MKKHRSVGRLVSYLLMVMILLSLFPAGYVLADELYVNDEHINENYINDEVQFPVYPAQGGIRVDKQAEWVSADIARLTLTLQGRPIPTPIDVVLVLDRTASMGAGTDDVFSRCTNPAHFTEYTYTKELTYQVNSTAGAGTTHAGWTTVTDLVAITLRYHQRGPTYAKVLDSVTAEGYRTTMGSGGTPAGNDGTGATVALYRRSASTTGTWTPGQWSVNALIDVQYRDFLRSNSGENPGFGAMESTPSGTPFPTTAAALAPGRDTYSKASYGCTFRIDDAIKAGKDFVDTIFAPYSDGSVSENRLGIVSFQTSATKADGTNGGAAHNNNMYDNTAENIAYLKNTFIGGLTVTGTTNYRDALIAAAEILEARTANDKETRPAFVVFMSDGGPNSNNGAAETGDDFINGTGFVNITTQRDRLENAGVIIYTVGLSMNDEAGNEILRKLSTGRSLHNRYYPVRDPAGLPEVFVSIAHQIKATATNAMVYDELSMYFDYYEDPDHQPYVSDGLLLANTVSPDGNAVLNWDLGNITSDVATLTYYAKIKDGYSYNSFKTNEEAYADYSNYLGNDCRYYFPVPMLYHDGGPVSVKIEYYKDDMDASGYMGEAMDEIVEDLTYGATYVISDALLDLNMPEGYKLETIDPASGSIELAASGNVIKVLYTEIPGIPYVVNYYKDEIAEENFIDCVEGIGSFGAEIEADLTLHAPTGYVKLGVRSGAETISAEAADNIVNVVYTVRSDLSVRIKYYQDAMTDHGYMGEDFDVVSDGLNYGEYYEITLITRNQHLDALPDNYSFDSMEPKDGKVFVDEEESVIKVLYTKPVSPPPNFRPPTEEIQEIEIPLSPFIPDHVAYIGGYPDGTVKPEQNITRAEVATVFFRLLTDQIRTYNWTQQNRYPDVRSGDWYNNAISVMDRMGIIKGYPDGTFKPNGAITRAELAAIAARFAVVMGMTPSNSLSFNDIAGHWAQSDINYAASIGWVTGYPDGSFKPDQPITRAEYITLVNRMLERVPENTNDLLSDKMIKWPDNSNSSMWYYLAIQEATNSHVPEFKDTTVPGLSFSYERWVEMLENRDWLQLETP